MKCLDCKHSSIHRQCDERGGVVDCDFWDNKLREIFKEGLNIKDFINKISSFPNCIMIERATCAAREFSCCDKYKCS